MSAVGEPVPVRHLDCHAGPVSGKHVAGSQMELRMRKVLAVSAALALPFVLTVAPAAADEHGHDGQTFVTQLDALNDSGASGTGKVMVKGDQLHVMVNSNGLLAEAPHAQHIHFGEQARHECPTMGQDDEDGDGFISTAEGQPAYGPISVSLTTEGDVTPESALAVDRFPTGDTIDYDRTFDVPEGFDMANLKDAVIVQHGIDVNGNGKYDMEAEIGASELDPSLPAEATHPATCGALNLAGAGGMATGAGGTAGVENSGLLAAGTASLLGAAALAVYSRRRTARS